jgi:hypothetical protein
MQIKLTPENERAIAELTAWSPVRLASPTVIANFAITQGLHCVEVIRRFGPRRSSNFGFASATAPSTRKEKSNAAKTE